MLELLKDDESLNQHTQIPEITDEPVVRILFDESHDELLRSQAVPGDDEVDTWSVLAVYLKEMGFDIDVFPVPVSQQQQIEESSSSDLEQKIPESAAKGKQAVVTKSLKQKKADVEETNQEDLPAKDETTEENTEEINLIQKLEQSRVLVFGAPREPLKQDEVNAIKAFVHRGGSLLIAHSYESLWWEDKSNSRSNVNHLLESFGLNIKQLLNWTNNKVDTAHLRPHYLSSSVNQLVVKEQYSGQN
jgi:hypothetical protein